METTELLERAWKNKESGDIDAAWKDVYQALVQLRNDLAAQPSAQICRWCNKPEAEHAATSRHKFKASPPETAA
jgi:hypothetical protein